MVCKIFRYGYCASCHRDWALTSNCHFNARGCRHEKFREGKTYSKEELQEVFDNDLRKALGLARQLMEENDVRDLPTTAQHTITEMCFQLGKSGVSKFRNMWKALQNRDFNMASLEMLDSKWNRQTPNRCKKLSDQMKSCA